MSRIESNLVGHAAFDHEIDGVASVQPASAGLHTPARPDIAPSLVLEESRLLHPSRPTSRQPELAQVLDDALAHPAYQPDPLATTTFDELLGKAQTMLSAALAGLNANDAAALAEAMQVLENERRLRALLALFRNAVLPG